MTDSPVYKSPERRFSNARKRDLGEVIIRALIEFQKDLTVSEIMRVCLYLYNRSRDPVRYDELKDEIRLIREDFNRG